MQGRGVLVGRARVPFGHGRRGEALRCRTGSAGVSRWAPVVRRRGPAGGRV